MENGHHSAHHSLNRSDGERTPLCAEDPNQWGYTGGLPGGYPIFIRYSLGDRSDLRAELPPSLTPLRTLRRAEASHPRVIPDQSPGHCAPLMRRCRCWYRQYRVGWWCTQGGILGYIPPWYTLLYTTWVYTGVYPPIHHLGIYRAIPPIHPGYIQGYTSHTTPGYTSHTTLGTPLTPVVHLSHPVVHLLHPRGTPVTLRVHLLHPGLYPGYTLRTVATLRRVDLLIRESLGETEKPLRRVYSLLR